jgi:hypothetical protein
VENAAGASDAEMVRFGLDPRPFVVLRRPAQ